MSQKDNNKKTFSITEIITALVVLFSILYFVGYYWFISS